MLRLNRLLRFASRNASTRASFVSGQQQELFGHEHKSLESLPPLHFFQKTSVRFFDIHHLVNKEKIMKERERIKDEMSRGYFADIAEHDKHGGKIAIANKVLIPGMVAVKFPDIEANYTDGRTLKLPIRANGNAADHVPKASLLCLSFRASSQEMINSWSMPFLDAFRDAKDIQLYQVSFIDSRLLRWSPIKKLLLRTMTKSTSEGNGALQKKIVYSFGDHYYFRKELRLLNLVTGYIFLLDKFGKIRWQGFGFAKPEELPSLIYCTSELLAGK